MKENILTEVPKLTRGQQLELKTTGMVIVGDRIIRTAAYMDRVAKGAKRAIQRQAKTLFGS